MRRWRRIITSSRESIIISESPFNSFFALFQVRFHTHAMIRVVSFTHRNKLVAPGRDITY